MKVCYDRRADEYDDCWLALGRLDGLERPRWDCGTGFLARHLRGEFVAVSKRYFAGTELAAELGGGEALHESRWFVVVCA